MRIRGGLIILAAVVGLSGCRSTSPNTPKAGDNNAAPGKSTDASLPPDVGGVIYGRVKDNYNQPVSKAVIQVVDLQESPDAKDNKARFEVATYSDGLFDIPGLKPGRRYRLIAHVDGSTQVGEAEVTTPERNVVIRLVDDPDAKVPAKVPGPDLLPEKDKEKKQTPTKVQVPLGTPSKDDPSNPDAKANPNTTPTPPTQPANTVDPSRVVDGSHGFEYVPQRNNPPSVSIPTPPPSSDPGRDQTQRVPSLPTPVAVPTDPKGPGSCVVSGDRVTDFTLYDIDGKPYQYRANSQGRVVLLFFWTSTDGASRDYLGVLENLHEVYSPYKLEVIGIAYEQGNLVEQAKGVRSARGRYGLRYTQLLGSDGTGFCQVRNAFGAAELPSLVLINSDGVITYRTSRLPIGDTETSKTQKAKRLHELDQKVREALRVTDP